MERRQKVAESRREIGTERTGVVKLPWDVEDTGVEEECTIVG